MIDAKGEAVRDKRHGQRKEIVGINQDNTIKVIMDEIRVKFKSSVCCCVQTVLLRL